MRVPRYVPVNRERFEFLQACDFTRRQMGTRLRAVLTDWATDSTTPEGLDELRGRIREAERLTAMGPDALIRWHQRSKPTPGNPYPDPPIEF